MKTLSLIIILSTVLLSSPGNVKVNHSVPTKYSATTFHKDAHPKDEAAISTEVKAIEKITSPATGTINSPMVADYDPDYSYLRFDVSDYMPEAEIIPSELPEQEFSYLKFDVTAFDTINLVSLDELPDQDFSYLKFDVNNFVEPDCDISGFELPEN